MKGKINVRFYSLNQSKLKKSIAHNFRLRRDLQNVNYDKSHENVYSHTAEEFRKVVEEVEHDHNELHKKRTGRNLRKDRINSLVEGVITFPRIYQTHYENGKFTKEQLLECFELFKAKYEEESNVSLKAYTLHTEEDTVHFHFWATNYHVRGEKAGSHFNPAGWKAYLQDIGGYAFQSLGLKRGTPKKFTRAKHTRQQEHYEKILDQSAQLEELLEEGLSIEEVTELISKAQPPLKSMLTYVKRSMNSQKEAEYQLKQQERALNKFREVFPNVNTVSNFEDLLNYIQETQKNFNTQNHKPRR